MAMNRVPTHKMTAGLGVAGMIFTLIALGVMIAFMVLLGFANAYFTIFLVPLVFVIMFCLVAAALTIAAACKDVKAIVITAMVFLIIGSIISFSILCQAIYGVAVWAYVSTLAGVAGTGFEAFGSGLTAAFAILAVACLGMFVVFIWASVMMCKFLNCCGGEKPQQTMIVMQVPPGGEAPRYTEKPGPSYTGRRNEREERENERKRYKPKEREDRYRETGAAARDGYRKDRSEKKNDLYRKSEKKQRKY